jgi:hypothetical protein
MFDGYINLGGTEILNADRTFQYVKKNLPSFPLANCYDCGNLREAIGDDVYESPLIDDAPWVDESNPATYDFFGVYPLEVQGDGESTRTTTVTESINSGGFVGAIRFATREIRVRGMLIARNDLALQAGLTWLRMALDPSTCTEHGGSCGGASMCYFAACPIVDYTCFATEAIEGPAFELGQITAAQSPTIFQLPTAPGAYQVHYLIDPSDGLVLSWGRRETGGPVIIEEFGPSISRRTNYVANPSFTLNTASWLAGGKTITRQAAGGADGGPYAQIRTVGPGSIRIADTDMPFGPAVASYWLRSPVAGTSVTAVIVTSDDGSVIASQPLTLTTEWVRYQIAVPYGRHTFVAFESNGEFDVDHVLLESGTTQFPYFDGSSSPEDASANYPGEYVVSWLGTPNNSPSRVLWQADGIVNGQQKIQYQEVCDANWRPYISVASGTLQGTGGFAVRPLVPVDDQIEPYERSYHDVTVIEGPLIIERMPSRMQGSAMIVDFVMVAATPFAFSTTREVLPMTNLADLPTTAWTDIDCPVESQSPVLDPDCPVPPPAPTPPPIEDPCIDDPAIWQRYWLSIPASEVSAWSQMLPTVTLSTQAQDVRQVRVRFYPNPFNFPAVTASRINYATRPALQIDASGWSSLGTGTNVGRTAVTMPQTGAAGHAYRLSLALGQTPAAHLFGAVFSAVGNNPVTPGDVITLSAYAKTSQKWSFQIVYTFYNAANAIVGVTNYGPSTLVLPANVWARVVRCGSRWV